MAKLLKMFLKGLFTTLMLPFIVIVWCLYSVYCLCTFVVMFFVNVVEFFRGVNTGGELIEDLESRKIILEKEQADEKTKQMVNILYQNALNQAAMAQQMQQQQTPVTPVQPYGIDNLSNPMPDPTPSPVQTEPVQANPTPETNEPTVENNEVSEESNNVSSETDENVE